MTNFTTTSEYKSAILAEWEAINDDETKSLINQLLEYAKDTEKLAKNRPARPRPEGSINVNYYREQIDLNQLGSTTLEILITNLLDQVEKWEEEIELAKMTESQDG